MLLHEERVRLRRMKRDAMYAVADFCCWVWDEIRNQTFVDRFPRFSAVVGPERARGRNCDKHSLLIFRIDQDRVQTHSARARLPTRTGIVLTQS